MAWGATFDAAGFESPGFAKRTIAALDQSFAQGAVAVKIWKTIGLLIRSKSGAYLMADDPALRPILDAVAARNKTLFAHLAEPITSWLPLEKQKPSHALYYGAHPEWHMYKHPGVPSKQAILAARDRMLAQHPKLRVVGCHLGSMEEDVADAARRLDRYPNFAVDTAARMPDLMGQPRDKVRAFLMRYQDRILYATDIVWTGTSKEADVMKELRGHLQPRLALPGHERDHRLPHRPHKGEGVGTAAFRPAEDLLRERREVGARAGPLRTAIARAFRDSYFFRKLTSLKSNTAESS